MATTDASADDVQAALVAWTSPSASEKENEDARLHRALLLRPWADAIADVCTSREDCILTAAQAFVETRFLDWVVDQRCNDPTWRIAQRGWVRKACDSGLAYGPWQVHDERFRGASPEFQASVAHSLIHSHPEAWTTRRAARSHAAWWLSHAH